MDEVEWKEDSFAAEIHVHEPPPSYQRRSRKTHSGFRVMKIWTAIPSLYVLLLRFLYPSCTRWHSMLGTLLLLYLNPHTVVHLNRQPLAVRHVQQTIEYDVQTTPTTKWCPFTISCGSIPSLYVTTLA